jgi:hypothetical protein
MGCGVELDFTAETYGIEWISFLFHWRTLLTLSQFGVDKSCFECGFNVSSRTKNPRIRADRIVR